jgi:hypothetical protein
VGVPRFVVVVRRKKLFQKKMAPLPPEGNFIGLKRRLEDEWNNRQRELLQESKKVESEIEISEILFFKSTLNWTYSTDLEEFSIPLHLNLG